MTYAQISEWVAENFDPGYYNTPQSFIQAVKDRFEEDGIFFPNEASDNLNELWKEQTFQNQPRDYDIDELQRQRYEQAMQELDEKTRAFLDSFPEQQYREYVAPIPEPEYAKEAPQPEYSREVQPKGEGFFNRLRRFFKRRE
jgi:hypothetical protein